MQKDVESHIPASYQWTLRSALPADVYWIAELRAVVMRPDLERLGRFDPERVRQRFVDAFDPARTFVIAESGVHVGVVAVRPETDGQWIEHFYIAPAFQGRGIGGQVLAHVMAVHADARPYRINVLQGSAARRLYERVGFVFESEDPVDVYLVAPGNARVSAPLT